MSNPHEEPATLINQIKAVLILKQFCSRDMLGLANQMIGEALVQIWVETYDDEQEVAWDEFQWILGPGITLSLLIQGFIIRDEIQMTCSLNPELLKVPTT